jgi:hypothetical protein
MGAASFRPLSALHTEPATGFKAQDNLSCLFQPTVHTRPAKTPCSPEYEILIFLYIEPLPTHHESGLKHDARPATNATPGGT